MRERCLWIDTALCERALPPAPRSRYTWELIACALDNCHSGWLDRAYEGKCRSGADWKLCREHARFIFRTNRYGLGFRTSKHGYGIAIHWGYAPSAAAFERLKVEKRHVGPFTIYRDKRGRVSYRLVSYRLGWFGVEFLHKVGHD